MDLNTNYITEEKLMVAIDLLIDHCKIRNNWDEIRYVIEKPYKYDTEIREAIILEYRYLKFEEKTDDLKEHVEYWKITKGDLLQ